VELQLDNFFGMNDMTDGGSMARQIALCIVRGFIRTGNAADTRCRVVGHHHDRMPDPPGRVAVQAPQGGRCCQSLEAHSLPADQARWGCPSEDIEIEISLDQQPIFESKGAV
jgi:hypothetical protein